MSEQPTPGWYPDPTRRFDHRYWDGGSWTEHVARGGAATTDPLDASGPPADTAVDTASTPSWDVRPARSTRTNTKAVASLVLSIIWFGGLASVPAVILGVMARREIAARPGESGTGVATAGIIIGAIGVLGAVLLLVAVLSFVAVGSGGPVSVRIG